LLGLPVAVDARAFANHFERIKDEQPPPNRLAERAALRRTAGLPSDCGDQVVNRHRDLRGLQGEPEPNMQEQNRW
jgi:hypothetical protein